MEYPPEYSSDSPLLFLKESADNSYFYTRIESEYLYWDKVKYLVPKEESVNLWKDIKLIRRLNFKKIYINNKFKLEANYGINDFLQQKLHYLDFNFGVGIQKEQLLSDIDKHRYLTNSLMEESIFSSMIEGATTTRIKAKEMLRKGKKPINKSEQMILNNYKTIQYISENKNNDITKERLFEIHKLVTENTLEVENVGVFRTSDDVKVMNQITGEIVHNPPVFIQLEHLMDSFCVFFNENPKENFIHPIVKASILHFLIGYIHPFVDGNGRTARALFYWYLLKNGYWLTEYLSISRVILKSKTQYEKAYLHTEIDEMDLSYFIHYQVKVLTQAFEDLKEYISSKKKEENQFSKFLKLPNINDRQAQILFWVEENPNRFFTVKEIENIFKITNQTARTDIEELVALEYLKKISINKKSFNYWKGSKFDKTFL
ncbi:Fic family protein [Flavobacterium arsenatis]|uniref:Fic family protein n=1 Tax=Flavobacterium arsenatis TaxID=1484332 RepID=A0ABU1TL34_9FLAO|nr:Fic family protein [Flavobacterium arsenatis]MDR6966669.1 Fic family protein [Flavobacterium arsenatis]